MKRGGRPVEKAKLFGDAMRNAAMRMSSDTLEAVAFFRSVEQLFDVFDVPRDLRATLIRPYLNDKAKAIVGRLGPDIVGDYKMLKETLLQEFKLTPNVYLDRFNSLARDGSETFKTERFALTITLSRGL